MIKNIVRLWIYWILGGLFGLTANVASDHGLVFTKYITVIFSVISILGYFVIDRYVDKDRHPHFKPITFLVCVFVALLFMAAFEARFRGISLSN